MATKESHTAAYIEKKKQKREVRYYFISFALMIALTLLAFGAVMMRETIDSFAFISFLLIIMALIQVVFQLYYFMHLKDKGHGMPSLMIWSGVTVAFITVLTCVSMIWL